MRIFFAGDFCSTSSTNPITVSDELKGKISSCDLKVCNFEVPLKPDNVAVMPGWYFYQNDDVPSFLKSLGFNIYPLANNHVFDYGDEGYRKTVRAFNGETFGSGTYDEAYRVKIVELNGKRVGFLALCFAARFGVFNDLSNHEGLGCAYVNDLCVNHVILEAKKQVDYLIVLPHDGIEYIDIPMPETIARYRDFIDYGADAVIGTHPHCPQGWETYKGRPIFYSLGNFLFNSKDGYDYRATNRPHWYEGLCVILTINDGMLSWEVINTRNVDNLRIEIDHDETRNSHNTQICRYLIDKEEYDQYMNSICDDLGVKELMIVDKSFLTLSIKECAKLFLKQCLAKLKGRKCANNYSLVRLLTHDARRYLLMQTLKRWK